MALIYPGRQVIVRLPGGKFEGKDVPERERQGLVQEVFPESDEPSRVDLVVLLKKDDPEAAMAHGFALPLEGVREGKTIDPKAPEPCYRVLRHPLD